MELESTDGRAGTLRLAVGQDELMLISNALNEVCNGMDLEDVEFSTRLGVERAEARALLAAVGAALDALPPRA